MRARSYGCATSPRRQIALLLGERAANEIVCSRSSTTKVGVRSPPTTQNSALPMSSTDLTQRALSTPSVAGGITALVNSVTTTTTLAHNAARHGTTSTRPHSTHLASASKVSSVALVPTSQPSTFGRLSMLSTLSPRPTNCMRQSKRGTSAANSC